MNDERSISMEWGLQLEPGSRRTRRVYDDSGDHLEWNGIGADEAETLAGLIGETTQQGASRRALD